MFRKTTSQEPYTDLTVMPFGKYEGTILQDIPASYLHYLWTNGLSGDRNNLLHQYVVKNLDALKMEDTDLLW